MHITHATNRQTIQFQFQEKYFNVYISLFTPITQVTLVTLVNPVTLDNDDLYAFIEMTSYVYQYVKMKLSFLFVWGELGSGGGGGAIIKLPCGTLTHSQ